MKECWWKPGQHVLCFLFCYGWFNVPHHTPAHVCVQQSTTQPLYPPKESNKETVATVVILSLLVIDLKRTQVWVCKSQCQYCLPRYFSYRVRFISFLHSGSKLLPHLDHESCEKTALASSVRCYTVVDLSAARDEYVTWHKGGGTLLVESMLFLVPVGL